MQHLHAGLRGGLENWLLDGVADRTKRQEKTKGETERHTNFYQTTATSRPLQRLDTHASLCNCLMQNKIKNNVAINGF